MVDAGPWTALLVPRVRARSGRPRPTVQRAEWRVQTFFFADEPLEQLPLDLEFRDAGRGVRIEILGISPGADQQPALPCGDGRIGRRGATPDDEQRGPNAKSRCHQSRETTQRASKTLPGEAGCRPPPRLCPWPEPARGEPAEPLYSPGFFVHWGCAPAGSGGVSPTPAGGRFPSSSCRQCATSPPGQ